MESKLNNQELKILSKWALSLVILTFLAVLLTTAGVGVSSVVLYVRTEAILRGTNAANCVHHSAQCEITGGSGGSAVGTCTTESLSTIAFVSIEHAACTCTV